MKKLIAITIIIMLCVSLAACMGNTTPTEETSTHTLPPTEESIAIEPEWAEVDCDMTLVDSDGNAVVAAEDFETFAVIESSDTSTAYITVKISQEATQMVNSMGNPTLSLTINGEDIPEFNFSTATGEIDFGHDMSYEQVCELATTIRGLFN